MCPEWDVSLQGILSQIFLLTPPHSPLQESDSHHPCFQDPGKGLMGPHTQTLDQNHLVINMSTVTKTRAETMDGASSSLGHRLFKKLTHLPIIQLGGESQSQAQIRTALPKGLEALYVMQPQPAPSQPTSRPVKH